MHHLHAKPFLLTLLLPYRSPYGRSLAIQFMRLAGSASVSSLGIDISTSSVTVIELAKFENTLSLLAYCRLPFPEESAFEEASEATSARAWNHSKTVRRRPGISALPLTT